MSTLLHVILIWLHMMFLGPITQTHFMVVGMGEVGKEFFRHQGYKLGFSTGEILRKYVRYALNEKSFNPQLVAALIQLGKSTMLDDSQVAEILNDISRRIVKDVLVPVVRM
ncbi:hypothetical protein Hanom_Chr02g00167141 [Helianthus anomalus]